MPRLELTQNELEVVKHAVEVINDMTTDTLLDDVSELWPSHEVTISKARAQAMREAIYEATDKLIAVRTLMSKLGLKTSDKGYSV
jgi:hypothetical protein